VELELELELSKQACCLNLSELYLHARNGNWKTRESRGQVLLQGPGSPQWRQGPASSIASTRPQQRLGRANAAFRRWSTRIGRTHRTHIALGPQVMQHQSQRVAVAAGGWGAKSRKSHRHSRLHQSRHHKITHRSRPLSANGLSCSQRRCNRHPHQRRRPRSGHGPRCSQCNPRQRSPTARQRHARNLWRR
jgi:hypothetical protein